MTLEVAASAGRPRLILNLVNEGAQSPPGKWRTQIGALLHTSVNSVHVLFRKLRTVTLAP